jgi:hypothetical protein
LSANSHTEQAREYYFRKGGSSEVEFFAEDGIYVFYIGTFFRRLLLVLSGIVSTLAWLGVFVVLISLAKPPALVGYFVGLSGWGVIVLIFLYYMRQTGNKSKDQLRTLDDWKQSGQRMKFHEWSKVSEMILRKKDILVRVDLPRAIKVASLNMPSFAIYWNDYESSEIENFLREKIGNRLILKNA